MLVRCTVLSLLALVLGSPALAEPIPLDAAHWEPKVFVEKGGAVREAEAAMLQFTTDAEQGACLAAGPWRAGQWSARFDAKQVLPHATGTVKGFYKTVGPVQPGGVEVGVNFYQGDRRVHRYSAALGPAEKWTAFAIPIRLAFPGADGLAPTAGLGDHTEGKVLFAKLEVTRDVSPEPPESSPETPGPITRPAPPTDFKPGRLFRLEERGGAWWLVAPSGKPFYSLGVDGPRFDPAEPDLATGRRHYETLRRMGFNSLAGWTDVPAWAALNDRLVAEGKEPLVIFAALSSGGMKGPFDRLAGARGQPPEGASLDHMFPDVFDPRWEPAYRARAGRHAGLVRGKAWFGGWCVDNELSYADLYRKVWSPSASKVFVEHLRERYHGDIKALNTTWGQSFASWDDLTAKKPEPALRHGAMYEDFRSFVPLIVKRYNEVVLRAIRDVDPDHLVFTNRFMSKDLGEWLPEAELYQGFDAVAENMYPYGYAPGLSATQRQILEAVHARFRKPILITEWSIPAIDSGLYQNPEKMDWSWPECVATQAERGRKAAAVTVAFHNLPFVVGSHWFIWHDYDSAKRQANRGLFKVNGEPWRELIEHLTRANRMILERN